MVWRNNIRWSKYFIISMGLHIALLLIPVSMVAWQKMHAIDVSLIEQNVLQQRTGAEKALLPERGRLKAQPAKPEPLKAERPKQIQSREKLPPAAQRQEEPKDVKAQIVSPGENTVMQVVSNVADAATGVALAGGKVGTGVTAIGGSMPGGTGAGMGYGYGGEGKGPIDAQFGRGDGPTFAYREMPEYPYAARRMGKEGRVVLQVTIDAKGKLEAVEVVEASDKMFTEAAIDSIKKSRFNPGKKNGVPCPYRCKLAVRFTLGS